MIKSGYVTDIYFKRTLKILKMYGLDRTRVRAEIHAYSLPKNYRWAVFAGLEEALKLLEGRDVDVYAVPEGTIFEETYPVMLVEGPVGEFIELETALLGIIRHASSVATKAARIKKLAGDRSVIFFGLRSAHPAIAFTLDRSAFIGGCDAVSGAYSEELLGAKPLGTMPHALIIVFGDQVKAWKAFDEVIEPSVPRIALVDTFYDERIETVLAVKALGERLNGVRLDTPSSRRGNMRKIVEEVRWTLNLMNRSDVKIYVSGGIDEKEVIELRDLVDGFGVGTSIAFPPSIDLSMDIVEIERDGRWEPIAKRGKLPGAKQVYICSENRRKIMIPWSQTPPKCSDNSDPQPLLKKYMSRGKIVEELPKPLDIRAYVLEQLSYYEL
ncbi:MAG: nicotinate phosphoribosyltransferase [Sulfolobales archaeon]